MYLIQETAQLTILNKFEDRTIYSNTEIRNETHYQTEIRIYIYHTTICNIFDKKVLQA